MHADRISFLSSPVSSSPSPSSSSASASALLWLRFWMVHALSLPYLNQETTHSIWKMTHKHTPSPSLSLELDEELDEDEPELSLESESEPEPDDESDELPLLLLLLLPLLLLLLDESLSESVSADAPFASSRLFFVGTSDCRGWGSVRSSNVCGVSISSCCR
jgi:hypothetical protein